MVDALQDKKGIDILVLDIHSQAVFADYFVICSGDSEPQLRALMQAAQGEAKKVGGRMPKGVEGAPADGWVLYAGDYLNYGQIVILDAGQDYTILLAGLDSIDAKLGQFVRMGDKLGTMGSRTIGRTVATSAGAARPTLYIEMRNKDAPIDPTGWWASPLNPTQSG